MANKMVPASEVVRWKLRGWSIVKGYGKDILMFKADDDLSEEERKGMTVPFRGG